MVDDDAAEVEVTALLSDAAALLAGVAAAFPDDAVGEAVGGVVAGAFVACAVADGLPSR